ncbi:hypothetical protein [Lederbergia graminis]|uniref:Uncharacterized protein n=1 Tax=Lederbergia graminis TaxID=735518 RepID=A0ABW0LGY2_9BACI|nr:hypothetical protein [Paenibacillus bovis]HLU21227.1 hypothetical protein [Bacillaceae bacterium]
MLDHEFKRPDVNEDHVVNFESQLDGDENAYSHYSGLAPIPPHIHGHLHGLEFFI